MAKEGFVGSYETRNAGKGDRARPMEISKQQYDVNYQRIFGSRSHPSQTPADADTVKGAPTP